MRRTFVCLGDDVNLSARLMSAAPPRRIYVSERVRQGAGDAFIWEALPAMKVKGKAAPVAVFALNGSLEKASRRRTRFELALVGRRRELAELEARQAEAFAGHGRVIGIAAEAGLGKSRLVAEFVRNVRRAGQTVAFGECQAYGTRTPYFVWREIWRRLFGLEDEDPTERQIAILEQRLAAVDPGLLARSSLLSDVVGLSIPDTEMTRGFDAKLRKSSLEDLLAVVFRARAREAPFVVVLEDCHWIDELSRDLLGVLVRAAASLPVLFVLAYRPGSEAGGDLGIAPSPGFSELALDRMEPADVGELVRTKLVQLLGEEAEPREPLVELVAARSEGNPFYVEELLNFIVNSGIDASDPVSLQGVRLPDSLQSLVLSRIDAASERPRRTMKVASVVGRVFTAPTLPGAYEELGSLADVLEDLDALRALDLVGLDREAEQAWMFKHMVTQEVTYESLPFALRAVLHGLVGDHIERTEADDLDRYVPLLEHHYWRSDRETKKREYLRLAAEQAQASYANNAAIVYFDRLLTVLDGAERVDAIVRLAQVLHVIGEIPRAEVILTEARDLAAGLGDASQVARCDHLLGKSARRVGRFDDAMTLLERAQAGFTEADNRAGLGDVLQVMGTVNAQRARPEVARARYEESLAIRERIGDTAGVAAITSNLGIVAQQLGDTERARAYAQRAHLLYMELGDRRRIASCEINLAWMDGMAGDHESERRHCEEAIRLALEVGDRLNVALAQNNLGDALRDLELLDEAGAAYAVAVETYRDLGDHAPLMALFEDVAVLQARRERADLALRLLGAADRLRQVMGSPRGPASEDSLAERLARARDALGDGQAEDARRAGAAMPLDEAIELTIASARSGD